MRRATLRIAGCAAAILICGCGGVEDERKSTDLVLEPLPPASEIVTTPVTYIDAGDICFYADGAPANFLEMEQPQRFLPGSRLTVLVAVPECLSQTCDINRYAACNIEELGSFLMVESELGYDRVDGPPCTLDCGQLRATCESAPLREGRYEIWHGVTRTTLNVPSEIGACSAVPMRAGE